LFQVVYELYIIDFGNDISLRCKRYQNRCILFYIKFEMYVTEVYNFNEEMKDNGILEVYNYNRRVKNT